MSDEGRTGEGPAGPGRRARNGRWAVVVATLALTGFLVAPGTFGAGRAAVAAPFGPDGAPGPSAAPAEESWVRTWQAAQQEPPPESVLGTGFGAVTVRMRVHTSLGGRAARLTLSNEFGTAPLAVAAVSVGRPARMTGSSADAEPGSLRTVTFSGLRGTTVPAGGRTVSDVVPFVVPSHADLLVSVAYAAPTGPATGHIGALSTAWVSRAGDWTTDPGGSAFVTTFASWPTVAAVDVVPDGGADVPVVVALGDSITDGARSTPDANRRWPDALADMMPRAAVVNAGINANRLLAPTLWGGLPAPARLESDVLAVPGARVVILLDGINDVRAGASADAVVAAVADLGRRARARGLVVVLGTLTPIGGTKTYVQDEPVRDAVNTWMLRDAVREGVADEVVDVAAALASPQEPERLDPAFDSGDHLHPNDAGYAKIAAAFEPAVRAALDRP